MRRLVPVSAAVSFLLACGSGSGGNGETGATDAGTGTTTTGSSTTGSTSTGASTTSDATASSSTSSGTGFKFDVPAGTDGPVPGCQKVDFLFVIDNSGSMTEEQQALVASFPGFISTIQDTLMAQDYQILVADTDEASLSFGDISCPGGVCGCTPDPQCCLGICFNGGVLPIPPTDECNGTACSEFEEPTGCDVTLGAGKSADPLGNDCGLAGGQRYIVDGQPDLSTAFECIGLVGAGGDGNERPMDAMTEAVGPLTQAGECNEGFLRDDAILVVTFITDEDDDGKSQGDPAVWKQYLVSQKNGDEEAVVVLGLVGDPDLPNSPCTQANEVQPAPVLRQFAESFTYGQWGSVCEPDYAPFFAQAVSTIDGACDDFVPPG